MFPQQFRLPACRHPYLLILLVLLVLAFWGASARAQQQPTADWWSAIRRDDVSAVQGMLLRGVDPTALNRLGNPALTQAARDQSWRVFDVLRIAPGVQIDEPNAHDETALMYLCIQGQTERAAALIQAGAQVNRLGWTPLHYAASRGQVETARSLIEWGAIVNAPGPDGTTPLMMAALSGKEPMVRLLLSQGADATMFNAAHETAADWARKRNNTALAAQLDALAAKVARARSNPAQHPGASAGQGAVPVPVTPSGMAPPAAPAAPGGQATSTAGTAAQGSPQEDQSSFSRYFDLGRFDEPSGH